MHLPRRNILLAGGILAAYRFSTACAAQGPDRILVVGDSQAQGLAGGLMRAYRRDKAVQVLDRSHIASGLASTNKFNWPEEIAGIAAEGKGAVALVMFGANDRPPIRPHGTIDAALSDKFRDVYGPKVHLIAAELAQQCTPVIWVGHPIVRDDVFAEDMRLLNQLYAEQAADAGAEWFPTWPMFLDEAGHYTAYGKGIDGQTARLRADDGVHLTPAGYDVLARALIAKFPVSVADAEKS